MPRSTRPAAPDGARPNPCAAAVPGTGGAPAAALVAGWPGPALLVTAAAGLTAASAEGRALVEADGPDAPWRRALFAWLDGSGPAGDDPAEAHPARHVSEIPQQAAPRWIEWTAVALLDNTVALLGRDVTLERAMHGALVDSRQRLRALVDLAGDLAFEVDSGGRFVFVSPDRVLGHAADDLIGAPADVLLAEPGLARSPFEARRPIRDAAVPLADAAGRRVPARVTARPILDSVGAWRGVRGLVLFERPAAGGGTVDDPGRDDSASPAAAAAGPEREPVARDRVSPPVSGRR